MGARRTASATPREEDSFELYDLRIEVIGCRPGQSMVCNHPLGAYFEVSGEDLSLPPGQTFPIYALAALLPLIPAKERPTHENDWMSTDMDVACPDPNCGGIFRITRTRKRVFRHQDVTAVPLTRTEV
jgi:uncharacterized repeat protein (TIGR04076 family)